LVLQGVYSNLRRTDATRTLLLGRLLFGIRRFLSGICVPSIFRDTRRTVALCLRLGKNHPSDPLLEVFQPNDSLELSTLHRLLPLSSQLVSVSSAAYDDPRCTGYESLG